VPGLKAPLPLGDLAAGMRTPPHLASPRPGVPAGSARASPRGSFINCDPGGPSPRGSFISREPGSPSPPPNGGGGSYIAAGGALRRANSGRARCAGAWPLAGTWERPLFMPLLKGANLIRWFAEA
jgi:hypothetical protein